MKTDTQLNATSQVLKRAGRTLLMLMLLSNTRALAQSKSPGAKVDLDDVQIKGELLSDDRINMLARKKNSLNDKIPLRTSFRQDILEELPVFFDSSKIQKSEKK